MTDQTRLAEIRARVEAATPGPWEFSESNLIVAPEPDDSDWWGEVASVTDSYFNNTVDADFIAHSRADVPFLLNLVASLTAERDALQAKVDAAVQECYDRMKVCIDPSCTYKETLLGVYCQEVVLAILEGDTE